MPSNFLDMVTKYEETLYGKMGKTAQFWMAYTKSVGLIQLMPRAVKINI